MGKRKPLPPLTEDEFQDFLISDASEALCRLGDVARTLRKQIDDGTLEERQETIQLYNRALRIGREVIGLENALRRRFQAKRGDA